MKSFKDFVAGAVVATIAVGGVTTAFARSGNFSIPVTFRNISIKIDGDTLITDKEPFIYDGTTYLPIRAVAEAVDKEVSWDDSTNTVSLKSSKSSSSSKNDKDDDDGIRGTRKVIYNDNGIKITFTGVEKASLGGQKVNLIIENNSDTDYRFTARNVYVNGEEISPVFSCSVDSGKKVITDMTFLKASLNKSGIEDIESIKFKFHMIDEDSILDYEDTSTIKFDID